MSDPTNDPYTGGDSVGERSDQWQADVPTDDRTAADEDRPTADRLGRDPSNLGDEVTDLGDVTHPSPEPPDVQM